MLEILLAGAVMASAAFTIRGARNLEPRMTLDDGAPTSTSDLPCPWCHAQTAETDASCSTCGQAFGN